MERIGFCRGVFGGLRKTCLRITRLPPIPTIPLLILGTMVFAAIFAPFLAPYPPNVGNLYNQFISPAWMPDGSMTYPLGTDLFGRDTFSRLVYGTRISLSVALIAVLFSGTIGTTVGLISGYFGGWVDILLMRLVDVMLAFPMILVAILIAVVLGASYINLILVIAFLLWPRYARQVRGEALSVKEQDYVAVARTIGCSPRQIVLRHIIPNVIPTLLVLVTLQIGEVILFESFLSFLGVGVPPPTPSWGSMISEGRDYLTTRWWLSVFPGIALLLTVLSGNLLGDWVRDRLDPKLRQV